MNSTREIIAQIRSNGNPDRAAKAPVMYPTSMEVTGISNPDLKKLMTAFYKVNKDQSSQWFISLAIELVHSKILECQMFAWTLLEKTKVIPDLTIGQMEQLKGLLDNWASVDTFGVLIFGPLWRIGTISDKMAFSLQKSEDVWSRRLTLVGTVALNLKSRGGTGDTRRTIQACEAAVSDHQDMIVKALSWALRALIRWDRDAVEEFIKKHENRLHGRVKREVGHKLQFGTKN